MDANLFKIILMIISILGTIITAFIVPWIKQKIGAENLNKIEYWTNIAVKAAEMIWRETGHGADKKEYVTKFLEEMFNSKKEILTPEQINALIEASVKALHIEEGSK